MGALTQSIKERIRSEILRCGVGISGSRLPSERELQGRYGVSRPTINRALNELAEEGLLVRIVGRGSYSIADCALGDAPITRESPLIGYVAGDMSSPNFGSQLTHRVFRGIHDAAARQGVRVLMSISSGTSNSERAAVASLIHSGAKGLVIWPYPRRDEDIENDYLIREDLGVPVVLLDNCSPKQGHIQIIFDNRRAGYDVTSWLIKQGHRRIAIITLDETSQHAPVLARLRGYLEALAQHEVTQDSRLIAKMSVEILESRYTDKARLDDRLNVIIDGWLALDEPPTAVVAIEDSTAMEMITQLHSRGIPVPDRICVTGFDNLDMAHLFRPVFTSTRPDFHRMGEFACDALLDRISTAETMPMAYVLEAPLIVRGPTVRGAQPKGAFGEETTHKSASLTGSRV